MSLQHAANYLASQGRGPDNTLVHMTRGEVQSLQDIARANGGSLTINPETGLVEAGFLKNLLPMIAGMALAPLTAGTSLAFLGATPLASALTVGGAKALSSGSLEKGLMAGLGAYGGANLMGGITAAAGNTASELAAKDIALGGQGGSAAAAQYMPSASENFMSGVRGLGTEAGRSAAINSLGGGFKAAQTAGMALAPVLADEGEQKNPPADNEQYNYDYNPGRVKDPNAGYTGAFTGERTYFRPSFTRLPNTRVTGLREGGAVRFDDGGPTDKEKTAGLQAAAAAQGVNVPFAQQATTTVPAGNIQPVASNPYYKMTGASGDAYKYLMGLGPSSAATTPVIATKPVITTDNTSSIDSGTGGGTNTGINTDFNTDFSTDTYTTIETDTDVFTDTETDYGTDTDVFTDTETDYGTDTDVFTDTETDYGTDTDIFTYEPTDTDIFTYEPTDTDIFTYEPTDTDIFTYEPTDTDIFTYEPTDTDIFTYEPTDTDIFTYEPTGTDTDVFTYEPTGTDTDIFTYEPTDTDIFTYQPDTPVTPSPDEDFPSTYPVIPELDPGETNPYEVQPWENLDNSGNYNGSMAGDVSLNSDKNTYTGPSDGFNLEGSYDFRGGDAFGSGYGGSGGGGGYFDNQGMATMAYARGGIADAYYSLGGYSDGGRLLRGPGDGVSDSIPATIGKKKQPARLADGEFVIPARIVSELGNGSTEAGARKLYAMMDRIQATRGNTTGRNRVATNTRADRHLPA